MNGVGGAAFPALYPRADEDGRMGMTLRDYFAAKAISQVGIQEIPFTLDQRHSNRFQEYAKAVAECAYMFADAMIEERNK